MHRIETIKKSAQQQQQMKINDQWNNNKWIREQIVEAAAAAVSNKKAHTCIEHLYVVAFPSPKLKKWKKKNYTHKVSVLMHEYKCMFAFAYRWADKANKWILCPIYIYTYIHKKL